MGGYDVALVLRGQDAPKAQAEALVEELGSLYPDTEVILLDGEQPIDPYIMVLD